MLAVKNQKKSLFGGALRCAGLAAATMMTSNASADFASLAPPGSEFTSNTLRGNAYGPAAAASFLGTSDTAAFPLPQSYTGLGLSMSAYAGSTQMGASINFTDAGIWSYSYVFNLQWFEVSSATKGITFEWDLTTVSSGISYVYEFGAGGTVALAGTAGSMTLTLTAGSTYIFVAVIEQTSVGNSYARISNVPAPGALGLLGLGALSTRRRRRRT